MEFHTVCWKLLYADDLMIIAGAEEFGRVGVHQGSDLSLFLFIIVRGFLHGVPHGLLEIAVCR